MFLIKNRLWNSTEARIRRLEIDLMNLQGRFNQHDNIRESSEMDYLRSELRAHQSMIDALLFKLQLAPPPEESDE